MIKEKLAWALFDYRTGNKQQLLGVLKKLNLKYEKIEIKYNKFAFLPNFVIQLFDSFLHIDKIKRINNLPRPDLLIACGRRTAPVAIKIYEKLSAKPFLIQLMYPRFTLKKNLFNMIITP